MKHNDEFPLVSIAAVSFNEEKRIKDCLEAVGKQTYPNIEVIIFDNNSTDSTKEIVKNKFPQYKLIESNKNYHVASAWNRCFHIVHGEYMLGLCIDVILDKDFIKNAVKIMETKKDVGVLQAKIYRMHKNISTQIIDTTGMEIFRSRRIINRGHGKQDNGEYDIPGEVFSHEGAAPFWRIQAVKESEVYGQFHDEDFVWYADDIDAGWRMRLFGWKNWYAPSVVAYHDRSTTKRLSNGYIDFIRLRKTISPHKRLLDWQNIHLTFIKNDFLLSSLKDFRFYALREIKLFLYILFFEPYTLLAIPRIFRLLPHMLKKRKYIMQNCKIKRHEMEHWFLNG